MLTRDKVLRRVLAEIGAWQQPISLLAAYWMIDAKHTAAFLRGRREARDEVRRAAR